MLSKSQGRPFGPTLDVSGAMTLMRYAKPVALLVCAFGGAYAAAQPVQQTITASVTAAEQRPHPRTQSYIKRRWGVEIEFVRQTAAGYMLEFRYHVIDSEKAAPLFDRRTKPVVEHVESGAGLIVPTPAKTGALRNSNLPISGRSYWMFFANPGKLVKQGEHVNIRIGDFEVRNLAVQ